MRITENGVGRGLVLWSLALVVVLAVLGLWVITGETGCPPAPPSVSGEALGPEGGLPAESEVSLIEAGPGITFTY